MSVTLDTNVLVYASSTRAVEHDMAQRLVADLATGNELLHLLWPTLLSYLRIVTSLRILPDPLTAREAMANVSQLVALPRVRTLGEDAAFFGHLSAAMTPEVRGDLVPDVHLVALMRTHGIRTIYTRDRGFRRFDGIEAIDPFA